jgi:hypothetical protein
MDKNVFTNISEKNRQLFNFVLECMLTIVYNKINSEDTSILIPMEVLLFSFSRSEKDNILAEYINTHPCLSIQNFIVKYKEIQQNNIYYVSYFEYYIKQYTIIIVNLFHEILDKLYYKKDTITICRFFINALKKEHTRIVRINYDYLQYFIEDVYNLSSRWKYRFSNYVHIKYMSAIKSYSIYQIIHYSGIYLPVLPFFDQSAQVYYIMYVHKTNGMEKIFGYRLLSHLNLESDFFEKKFILLDDKNN